MKKTLTVNLGGTVFHIDEDAYKLLDEYLRNLKLHFGKQEGADEIINDIETRISELFLEKINGGAQVITIETVDDIIKRMGRPEELTGEEQPDSDDAPDTDTPPKGAKKRLYRNPDDKILGGVVGGLAEYLGWDATLLRLLLVVVGVFAVGTVIPVYIVCWIIIPEARTAEEKLNMRGEEVTMESIGKTVTEGFNKVTSDVNDYINSPKPRNFFQKFGDVLVTILEILIKAMLVLFVIICSPILFALAVIFIVMIIAVIAAAIGGGAALYSLSPVINWEFLSGSPILNIVVCISGILLLGIPLAGIVFGALRQVFSWKPMSSTAAWILFILWVISLIVFILGFGQLDWVLPHIGIYV